MCKWKKEKESHRVRREAREASGASFAAIPRAKVVNLEIFRVSSECLYGDAV